MNRAQETEQRIIQLKYATNRLENDEIDGAIAHFAWLNYRVIELLRAEIAETRKEIRNRAAGVTVPSFSEDAGQ